MNKLVLFDIDGTLTRGLGDVHFAAFSYAIKKVSGIETSITKIDHNGKTDKQLIVEILKKEGLEEVLIRSKLEEIIKEMVTFFDRETENKKMEAIEGAKELLDSLTVNNVLTGLVTGNLESIGMKKLKIIGLDKYFNFGGFGSDGEKRSGVVKLAIKRAEKISGHNFNLEDIFIIGDTPRDIIAGREAGVKTIVVTTGKYSEEDLKAENPNFIFKNLTYKKEILEILLD
ncbi:HAD hydrolase-like protein [Patescibacteria group bacterium]|nr:HAD hydrolase-like protein [Patescibacteria group bacterium]MBU1876998.1 HAD hydrolase-like protein [Patescibacteria group bacterium]